MQQVQEHSRKGNARADTTNALSNQGNSSVDSHFETKYKINEVKHGEEDSMYVAGPNGYVEEGTFTNSVLGAEVRRK